LDGIGSQDDSRVSLSLSHLLNIVIDCSKVFRRNFDITSSFSSTTSVNNTPNVSVSGLAYLDMRDSEQSISLPYGCHEIFKKCAFLLSNSIHSSNVLRLMHTIVPFVKLHLYLIKDNGGFNDSQLDNLIFQYALSILPTIQYQSDTIAESLSNSRNLKFFSDKISMLVCDLVLQLGSIVPVFYYHIFYTSTCLF
jgi:hypothetical protein